MCGLKGLDVRDLDVRGFWPTGGRNGLQGLHFDVKGFEPSGGE